MLQEENRALQQTLDHAPSHAQLEEAQRQIGTVCINWRASEASETLFSHVYGNSRYIYVYMRTSVSNTHARVIVL